MAELLTQPLVPYDFTQGETMNRITIPCDNLQTLSREEYQDDFGFYQSLFGLYSYMELNRLGKFTVTTVSGSPGIWGELNGCTLLETGVLKFGEREITPIPIYSLATWCSLSAYDKVFKTVLEWTNGGEISEESRNKIWNVFVKELMANATLSLRITLTINKLHDLSNVATYASGVDATRQAQLTHVSANNSLVGLFAAIDAAYVSDNVKYAHLNYGKGTFIVAGDFVNKKFQGNIVAKLDELIEEAPDKLASLINSGGMETAGGKDFTAVIGVSNSYMSAFAAEYRAQKSQAVTNDTRITREQMTVGGRTKAVYFLDDMPVVPMTEVCGLDDMFAVGTHIMGIFGAGVLQLGSSFAAIPDNVEDNQVGYVVERSNTIQSMGQDANGINQYEMGRYKAMSHALGANAIADTDYLICSIATV